jgi:ketosteroid isomerase-like protein
VDGDAAVVHSAGLMKHVPSGSVFQTEILDKLALRDGKIIEFIEFADTHPVAQVLGLSSS